VKLDALDHPKTLDLAARLNVSRPTAIGHLELLWAFTGQKSAQGNVGKWPDGAIARACDWMGNPQVFITALIDAGFLEKDDQHRLLVHDWQVHATGWVRAKLKNAGIDFIRSRDPTREPSLEEPLEPPRDASRDPPREPSIQAKRSVAKSTEARSPKGSRRVPEDFSPDLAYARAQIPDIDAEREAQRFRDWEFKTPRKDWTACWRTWIGNCRDRGQYARLNGSGIPEGKWM
jgi:hypothetical protein